MMNYQNRLSPAADGSTRTVVRIEIDSEEMNRFVPDYPILADASQACSALVQALEKRVTPDAGRQAEIAEAKAKAATLINEIQPQVDYWNTIRGVLPRDGFIVPEVSQMGFTSYFGLPIYTPRTYVTEGFQGTLGFGFPTALGVKAANPDKAVINVTGDGGFMFAMSELATAAQYNLGLVTLVFNNSAYGNVLRDQKTRFGGRVVGAELQNPDFVKLAESFGVKGVRVTNPAELKPILAEAIESEQPVLIEVFTETGSESVPWTLVHMAQSPMVL